MFEADRAASILKQKCQWSPASEYLTMEDPTLGVAKASQLKSLIKRGVQYFNWCPGPELNRYSLFKPTDFKSVVSTNFTTRAK